MSFSAFEWTPILMILYGICIAVVHIAFAIGVLNDGLRLRRRRSNTFLVSPGTWALATLLLGVFCAVGYWIVHHSTLRRIDPPIGGGGAGAPSE